MNNITLAIPNRNNEKYLRECLRSVINQSSTHFDILISDNGSTDTSKVIINETIKDLKNVRFILTKEDLSYSEHLIWIHQHVKTKYVIFLAGDDIIHRDLIKTYDETIKSIALENLPSLICSPFYYIDECGRIIDKISWLNNSLNSNKEALMIFLKGPICNISSVAWNHEILQDRIKYFNKYGNCIDWFLYISFAKDIMPIVFIKKHLLMYRIHNQSTGNSNVKKHTEKCFEMFMELKNDNSFTKEELKLIEHNLSSFKKVLNEDTPSANNNNNRRLFKLILNKLLIPYYFFLNIYFDKKCLF